MFSSEKPSFIHPLACLALLSSLSSFAEDIKAAPLTLPSSRPEALQGWNLFVTGDWLYWKASETGLGYALNQEGFREDIPELMGFGDVANPDFSWESGFRVGLGYNFPRDQWTLGLVWTWYEGKANGSISASSGPDSIIYPSLIHPNFYNDQNIFSCDSARSRLLLHLNILDLDLSRQYKTGKHLSLKPYIGIRSAWVDQNYDVSYKNLSSYDLTLKETVPALKTYTTAMTNNFWGLGPLGGLGTDWSFGWGLSLFGDFSLSLLYGQFSISHSENFIASMAEGLIISEKNTFFAGRLVTDIQLGLRWSSSFANDHLTWLVQGGWEHHAFFSQNQMFRFVSGQNLGSFVQNQGDLYFQGWSISTGLYF